LKVWRCNVKIITKINETWINDGMIWKYSYGIKICHQMMKIQYGYVNSCVYVRIYLFIHSFIYLNALTKVFETKFQTYPYMTQSCEFTMWTSNGKNNKTKVVLVILYIY
jgi:hypothetical protein